MLPAGEGFEAAEEAGAKLYEWLKVRNDFVAFECSAQIICVISSHGTDDTTAATAYTVNFRAFQRLTRSRAASCQWEKVNWKPAARRRPGTTWRLFKMSSDSVRMRKVPISIIHDVVGR